MRSGRRIGLATAFGVLCGSLTWGLLAAGGIAADALAATVFGTAGLILLTRRE